MVSILFLFALISKAIMLTKINIKNQAHPT